MALESKARHVPTILVVDDEEDIRESLRIYLQATMPGTRIIVAPSAEAALPLVEREGVDAIVSDLRMPGMDGLELLRRVRGTYPGVGCILVTAYPQPDLEAQAERAGVAGVLRKPFEMQALQVLLADVLA